MKIFNQLKAFFSSYKEIDTQEKTRLERLTDTGPIIRKAYIWVVLSFVLFTIWAIFVPLDEGVPVMGSVVIDTKAKSVQHFQGGVIREVFVKEGEFVNEGDVLIKLGDLTASANLAYEKNRLQKLSLLEKELKVTTPLVKEGYLPLIRQYELEKEIAELKSAEQRYKATQDELLKTQIRAPVSGQVIGIANQTIGGVIQPGQKIMEIVPQNEQLVVELKIPPHLIDRVRARDYVDLRFFGFANTPMLVVDGIIESLSINTLNDPNVNPANQMALSSYYLARVVVTSDGVKKLRGRQMISGMEVGGVVKTGQRTLMQYILAPLTKRIAFSMKEE